jgi:N-acyl-phosphatidylethanolamine-hydrolysing phospholipase D
MAPAIQLNDLPKIDFILISHNHYDHLNAPTIRKLIKQFPDVVFCVPLGLKKWFTKRKIAADRVIELDWWEKKEMNGITVHAVPSQHWSGRTPFNQNKSLWCGYVVEDGHKKFYFTGDTGYNEIDFQMIGNTFQRIDLSIIPIGDYIPKRFMKPVHNSPEEAIYIHREVKSKLSVACHFATFNLAHGDMSLPPYDLYKSQKRNKVSFEEFLLPTPGKTIYW